MLRVTVSTSGREPNDEPVDIDGADRANVVDRVVSRTTVYEFDEVDGTDQSAVDTILEKVIAAVAAKDGTHVTDCVVTANP